MYNLKIINVGSKKGIIPNYVMGLIKMRPLKRDIY